MNQGNWSNIPPPQQPGPNPRLIPPGAPGQQFQNFPNPPQQQNPSHLETAEQAKTRFEIECEFVQSLANPHYLNYLAQRGYFKEATFVRYLKYLCYFKEPNYARTLKYPQALTFLDLLQKAEFREKIALANNAKFIEDQMLLQWHYYLRKRQRLSKFTGGFKESSPEEEDDDEFYRSNDVPTSSEPASESKNSSDSTDEPMDEDDYPTPTPDDRTEEESREPDDDDDDDDDDDEEEATRDE